jgi:hypothetical protein
MKEEWYVTFKVKHDVAINGKSCDYYAVKCIDKQNAEEVVEMVSGYHDFKYPRIVNGMNNVGSTKRNVISYDIFVELVKQAKNAVWN